MNYQKSEQVLQNTVSDKGDLVCAFFNDGTPTNALVMSVLKEEFFKDP